MDTSTYESVINLIRRTICPIFGPLRLVKYSTDIICSLVLRRLNVLLLIYIDTEYIDIIVLFSWGSTLLPTPCQREWDRAACQNPPPPPPRGTLFLSETGKWEWRDKMHVPTFGYCSTRALSPLSRARYRYKYLPRRKSGNRVLHTVQTPTPGVEWISSKDVVAAEGSRTQTFDLK